METSYCRSLVAGNHDMNQYVQERLRRILGIAVYALALAWGIIQVRYPISNVLCLLFAVAFTSTITYRLLPAFCGRFAGAFATLQGPHTSGYKKGPGQPLATRGTCSY